MQAFSLVPFRLLAAILLAVALVLAALPFAGKASAVASPLLISEYVSGSGNNKALEIYNSGPDLNLAALPHSIEIYFDGSSVPGALIPLNSGVIAAGEVLVVAHPDADQAILDMADQWFAGPWFDGNDTVTLMIGGHTIADRLGRLGEDPGTAWGDGDTVTTGNSLRRQESVTSGNPNFWEPFDPSAEWVGAGLDVFDGLGCWGESACVTDEPPTDGTPFDALRDLVKTYRDDASLDTDAADALGTHLDRAEDLFDEDKVSGAKGQLRAFVGRLRAFESRGLLGAGEAAALAAASQELIDSL